jgi:hypothetical protein
MTTPQNDPSQQPYFGADGTQTGFGPGSYGAPGPQDYQGQPGYAPQPGYAGQPGYPNYQGQPSYQGQPGYPGAQGYPGGPGYGQPGMTGMPGPAGSSPMVSAAWRRGRNQAITGAVLIAVGLVITIVTASLAAANGGFYVVSYGPIIFGVLRLVRGLTAMSRARKIGQ